MDQPAENLKEAILNEIKNLWNHVGELSHALKEKQRVGTDFDTAFKKLEGCRAELRKVWANVQNAPVLEALTKTAAALDTVGQSIQKLKNNFEPRWTLRILASVGTCLGITLALATIAALAAAGLLTGLISSTLWGLIAQGWIAVGQAAQEWAAEHMRLQTEMKTKLETIESAYIQVKATLRRMQGAQTIVDIRAGLSPQANGFLDDLLADVKVSPDKATIDGALLCNPLDRYAKCIVMFALWDGTISFRGSFAEAASYLRTCLEQDAAHACPAAEEMIAATQSSKTFQYAWNKVLTNLVYREVIPEPASISGSPSYLIL